MDMREVLKNRVSADSARDKVIEFCSQQHRLFVATNSEDTYPLLDAVEYVFHNGEQFIVLTPMSVFLNQFVDGSQFSGLLIGDGRGLKMTARLSGNFSCLALETDAPVLLEIAEFNPMVKKMLSHGAKFFKLSVIEATIYFNPGEIFALDNELNTSFATHSPDGRQRFENSRHVLMSYLGKEIVFNVIEENGVYYTLTRASSNKVSHIRAGGECMIYDGADNHFVTNIQILADDEVSVVFNKLSGTNNSFFKNTDGLLALSFSK